MEGMKEGMKEAEQMNFTVGKDGAVIGEMSSVSYENIAIEEVRERPETR